MIYKIIGLVLMMPMILFVPWAFCVVFLNMQIPNRLLKINPIFIGIPLGFALAAGFNLLFK